MGWGRTVNSAYNIGDVLKGGAHSKILQKLSMSIMPNEECKSIADIYKDLTNDKQVCASTGRRGNIVIEGLQQAFNNFETILWHCKLL